VYFEANLSVPSTEDQRLATQKLITTVLKLDPSHFKEKIGAAVDEHAVVISLCCRQNNSNSHGYWRVSTCPAIPISHEPLSEQQVAAMTEAELHKAALYSQSAAEGRTMVVNLLQIQFGNLIDNSFLQAGAETTTTPKWSPNPTANPALIVDISLPKPDIASDSTYEKIAHCLADTVVKASSEISASN
jgi:hypothetical protein